MEPVVAAERGQAVVLEQAVDLGPVVALERAVVQPQAQLEAVTVAVSAMRAEPAMGVARWPAEAVMEEAASVMGEAAPVVVLGHAAKV